MLMKLAKMRQFLFAEIEAGMTQIRGIGLRSND